MGRLQRILLILAALLTGGGGVWLYLNLGNDAWPPALLGVLIAITCLMRLLTRNR